MSHLVLNIAGLRQLDYLRIVDWVTTSLNNVSHIGNSAFTSLIDDLFSELESVTLPE